MKEYQNDFSILTGVLASIKKKDISEIYNFCIRKYLNLAKKPKENKQKLVLLLLLTNSLFLVLPIDNEKPIKLFI